MLHSQRTAGRAEQPDADRAGVAAVVARLRLRRDELTQAIYERVSQIALDPGGAAELEYLDSLRATIAAVVDYGLAGIERGGPGEVAVPREVGAQARRAARQGMTLDAVLRRYIAGSALLWDFVAAEAEQAHLQRGGRELRSLALVQSALLDRLVVAVADELGAEAASDPGVRERRVREMVRALLAGGTVDAVDLGYGLEGEHVALIACGAECRQALAAAAEALGRQLLSVAGGQGTVWAWIGGRRAPAMRDLQRVLCARRPAAEHDVESSFALGEPGRGVEGWRLSHRQAQAALLVSLRRPRRVTRYGDVAVLAALLRDEPLARSLIETYLAPLADARDAGEMLRRTLRAYLDAQQNVSSAAALLKVARSTVESRLRAIEERLERPLRPCPPELGVALDLHELLRDGGGPPDSSGGPGRPRPR